MVEEVENKYPTGEQQREKGREGMFLIKESGVVCPAITSPLMSWPCPLNGTRTKC